MHRIIEGTIAGLVVKTIAHMGCVQGLRAYTGVMWFRVQGP